MLAVFTQYLPCVKQHAKIKTDCLKTCQPHGQAKKKKSNQGAGEVLWTALAVVLLLLEEKYCRDRGGAASNFGPPSIGLTNGCKLKLVASQGAQGSGPSSDEGLGWFGL